MRAPVVPLLLSIFAAGSLFAAGSAPEEAAKGADEKAPASPPPSAAESANSSAAVDGIAAGAMLGLGQITAEDRLDDFYKKRFTLRIPIKARPQIDPHQLVIQVLFYDIVDDKNVVNTNANVSNRWVTPPADWARSDTEELEVGYRLPKWENERRTYFGYIVRLYYKGQLQAATAEPESLAKSYPAAATLPADPSAQVQSGASPQSVPGAPVTPPASALAKAMLFAGLAGAPHQAFIQFAKYTIVFFLGGVAGAIAVSLLKRPR
jgi:hypothetical protein